MKQKDAHTTVFDADAMVISDLDEDLEHPLQNIGAAIFKRLGIKVVAHPVQEEVDEDECDFDIRMMDVPDEVLANNTEFDLPEVRFATASKRLWERIPRKRLFTVLLLGILLGISSFGQIFSRLPPTTPPRKSTSYSSSIVARDNPLPVTETNILTFKVDHSILVTARTLPDYCPSGEMLGQGNQIGSFPVWLLGIDSTAKVQLPPISLKTIDGWKGWAIPLQLHGKYTYLQTITLTVVNLNGTSSPLLQTNTMLSSRLVLDAQHPMHVTGVSTRKVGIWDISLFLPGAGCYAMVGAWGHGHWMITFSAGS